MHVNLLPTNYVWKRAIRKIIRQWCIFIGCIGLGFFAFSSPLIRKWWTDTQELAMLQSETVPIVQLRNDRIQLDKKTAALRQKVDQLRNSIPIDRSTAILGILSNCIEDTEKTVQIQELQVAIQSKVDSAQVISPNVNSDRITGATKKTTRQHQMTIRAIAVDGDATFRFMQKLQETNVFPKVELRSTQERSLSNQIVQEFQLECLGDD